MPETVVGEIVLPVVVTLVELEYPGVELAGCLKFLVVVGPAFQVSHNMGYSGYLATVYLSPAVGSPS